MTAIFNWTIPACERNVEDGGVAVAHWRCDASETVGEGDDEVTHYASAYGAQVFTPNPDDAGFIAYENLTEDTVKGWVWAAEVDKTATETNLQAQIDELKTPATATGVPWV